MKRKGSHTLKHRVQKVEKVQRQRRPETKVLYRNTGLTAILAVSLTTAGIVMIPPVPVGTSAVTRIGDKLTVTRSMHRFVLHNAAVNPETNLVRIIVVQQKAITGVVLEPPALGRFLAVDAIRSPMLRAEHRRDFHLLHDRTYKLGAGTVAYRPDTPFTIRVTRNLRPVNINLRLPIKTLTYVAGDDDILLTGQIYYWIVCDNIHTAPAFTLTEEFAWMDM